MSATIFTFPGVHAAVPPANPSQLQEGNADTRTTGGKKSPRISLTRSLTSVAIKMGSLAASSRTFK